MLPGQREDLAPSQTQSCKTNLSNKSIVLSSYVFVYIYILIYNTRNLEDKTPDLTAVPLDGWMSPRLAICRFFR